MIRANECTFSGTTRLDQLVWNLLACNGVGRARLNQRNVYTFRISSKDINRINCPSAIYYMGSADRTTMKSDAKDPLHSLVPCIPAVIIPAKALKQYNDVFVLVGRNLSTLVRQCSLSNPIQYISIKSVNRTYQVNTSTGVVVNKMQELFKKTPNCTIDNALSELPENDYVLVYKEHQQFLDEH